MARIDEIHEKKRRVRKFLAEHDLDAIILSRQDNFAWYTAGGDNHVNTASEEGVASLLLTRNGQFCLASNIECNRIMNEELIDEFEPVCYDWFSNKEREEAYRDMISNKKVASDTGIADTPMLDDDFYSIRRPLTIQEITKYRWIGRHTSEAMEAVAKTLKIGDTEYQVASELARAIYAFSITPMVILVAADDRIGKYRHPIPTQKSIEKAVMMAVCARRWGLIISMTRHAHFGAISGELRTRHDAVVQVDSVFLHHTKPGAPVGEIFQRGVNAYKTVGFEDEWRLHHQGGPTGYGTRDFLAKSDETRKVVANQAYAWNPSITGTKSEDTIVTTEDKPIIITESIDWPTIEVEVNGERFERPDILIRR